MKIGILTLPLHTNYGGILQAYALQTVLERMGHEAVVIDQDRNVQSTAFRQSLRLGKYLAKKCLLRRNATYYDPKKVNRERKEREQFTRAFINNYIHTYIIRDLTKDVPSNLDAIVVGSDQVWRHRYFTGMYRCGIENAFLKFAEGRKIKRIAYAASFGTDDWEYSEEETKECARLLATFDAVSVRESSAVGLCKDKLGRDDAQHLLDPTLLLSKEDYIRIVENAKAPQSPGNMLCYVLDASEEKQALVGRIAGERHQTPFKVNSRVDDATASQQERIQPPLEQWLRGFMDAEFVVTDSFHACVFSIIFGKPFVVVGNKKRGMARFESLLTLFGLEQNLLYSSDGYSPSFGYTVSPKATEKLDVLKQRSVDFLMASLVKG